MTIEDRNIQVIGNQKPEEDGKKCFNEFFNHDKVF
jgi:hypothetical protein